MQQLLRLSPNISKVSFCWLKSQKWVLVIIRALHTIRILCIGTDRSQQTEQTKIRLLLIRVYAVCHSISIFWMYLCNVTSNFSIFLTIMATVWGVPNFRIFTVRGVFDDKQKFSYFSLKPYVVSPHLNRLVEPVQIRGNNICFMENSQKLSLIIIKYTLISTALYNIVLNNHAQILCIT